MPELVFFCGTMDCGKSTLALQIEHNRSARGLQGMIFSRDDRAGEGKLSSRLGLVTDAVEVGDGQDPPLRGLGHAAFASFSPVTSRANTAICVGGPTSGSSGPTGTN